MPREALEPGAPVPAHKLKPIKSADGIWRLTDIRHRTISGTYIRTSAQGRTRKECLEQFQRRWEVNRRKGTVRRRADAGPQFALTDKMSRTFEHYDRTQKARYEAGRLKWNSYNDYHGSIYAVTGSRAREGAIKLENELGGHTIGEIGRPAELHAYICDIADLSPATAYRHHVILKVIFKTLTLQGLYDSSPMREVPPPIVTAAKPQRALTAAERAELIRAMSRTERWTVGNHYILAATLTMLGTGLRPGEALALRWCDIPNLDNPAIECAVMHVHATMVRYNGIGARRQESRKAGEKSEYWVTLPRWLTRELRAWKRICHPADDTEHLFTGDGGTLLYPSRLAYPMKKLLREDSSLEWFGWGNLRDTAATEVAGRSGDKRTASAQLGHSEGSTLADRRYIDPRGFIHQVVDNSALLEFLCPVENDGKVTILESVHSAQVL